VGPCQHSVACPWVVNVGDGIQIWRVAVKVLNKHLRAASGVVLQLGGGARS
jgi:hypothetical protein